MTTRTALAVALSIGFSVFGCDYKSPTAPEETQVFQQGLGSSSALAPMSALSTKESGKSGCYTVSGAMDQVMGAGGVFSGTISGDLEGTVVTTAVGFDLHGVTVHRFVEQTWVVTGGIIDPLIGQTVLVETDFMAILAKLPILRLKHTARIIAGAEKGNLTYHGFTDAFAGTSYLEYRGVICP